MYNVVVSSNISKYYLRKYSDKSTSMLNVCIDGFALCIVWLPLVCNDLLLLIGGRALALYIYKRAGGDSDADTIPELKLIVRVLKPPRAVFPLSKIGNTDDEKSLLGFYTPAA